MKPETRLHEFVQTALLSVLAVAVPSFDTIICLLITDHSPSNPPQSFLRDIFKTQSSQQLPYYTHSDTNNCCNYPHVPTQTWHDAGLEGGTAATIKSDYINEWDPFNLAGAALDDCQNAYCCDDINCPDLIDPCFDQFCEVPACPDSHGGRLLSAEPCFDAAHQYLPPCNDPDCAFPDGSSLVIDTQLASAASQLQALNKEAAILTPLSVQTQEADLHNMLDKYTHHSAQYQHDSGVSGLSRSNTTSMIETEDELTDDGSSADAQRRKRPHPRHRHICIWTDPSSGDICGQQFREAADLHSHVDRDHIDGLEKDDKGRYRCHWTGCKRTEDQTFTAKPKLKRHVQTHTHHKPYQCQHCNTNMKTKDALEKHTRIHTGEAPYKCTECQKTFKTSTEHKTHMTAVHSNQKPHECPYCGQRFADSSNLSKHKKTHWTGSFKCLHPGCKAHMKRWDQIRRHFQTQGHCPDLLIDGSEAQRRYKKEMQESWLAIPEEDRLLMDKAAPSLVSETSKLSDALVSQISHGTNRDRTEDVEDAYGGVWVSADGMVRSITPSTDVNTKRPYGGLLDQDTMNAKKMKLEHLVEATSFLPQ